MDAKQKRALGALALVLASAAGGVDGVRDRGRHVRSARPVDRLARAGAAVLAVSVAIALDLGPARASVVEAAPEEG